MALKRNRVELIGRVGREPELKTLPSGQTVASFSLATDEGYKGKDGVWVDRVEWHSCTTWGKQAEFVSRWLKKGTIAFVEGKLQSRKYADKDGIERTAVDIVVSDVGIDFQTVKDKPNAGDKVVQDYAELPNATPAMDEAPF
jgi:single-strand DNA-binding protein